MLMNVIDSRLSLINAFFVCKHWNAYIKHGIVPQLQSTTNALKFEANEARTGRREVTFGFKIFLLLFYIKFVFIDP